MFTTKATKGKGDHTTHDDKRVLLTVNSVKFYVCLYKATIYSDYGLLQSQNAQRIIRKQIIEQYQPVFFLKSGFSGGFF